MQEFDLEERTSTFGIEIIGFAKTIPVNNITAPLINQIVRLGTSVGTNYCEANESVSKKEFKHKISICAKEAKETKYWLHMISTAVPDLCVEARRLWKEAKELHLIFSAIKRKCQQKVEN